MIHKTIKGGKGNTGPLRRKESADLLFIQEKKGPKVRNLGEGKGAPFKSNKRGSVLMEGGSRTGGRSFWKAQHQRWLKGRERKGLNWPSRRGGKKRKGGTLPTRPIIPLSPRGEGKRSSKPMGRKKRRGSPFPLPHEKRIAGHKK